MPRLVVVGSYNTDLIIWCDRIPTKGETLMGGDSEMFSGGRGANCAVAAARAGCEVGFVGAHGPDAFGKMALNRMELERIDISNFVELPFSKTGLCLIFHERAAGAHAALVANSANNQFPASLVRKAEPAIREADLIFTVFEIGHEAVSEEAAGLAGKPDSEVRQFAIQSDRILVTLDIDFASLIRFSPRGTPGVIWLRPRPPTEVNTRSILSKWLPKLSEIDLHERLVIVDFEKIRIRRTKCKRDNRKRRRMISRRPQAPTLDNFI
jgi:predicted nuclease of predicted toxin-antitoxin system